MRIKRRFLLVRYYSPFASPTWMPEHEAERHLKADQALWERLGDTGSLSKRQKEAGPPHIDRGEEDGGS